MKTVLCYGDSNTYGYNPSNGMRFDEDIRWSGRLKKALSGKCNVIEEGCNGRTTCLEDPFEAWKSGASYLKACLNSHKPVDLVLIMLGSNDLKTVFGASAEEIAEGAGALAADCISFLKEKQEFAPQVLLISPILIGEGICRGPFAGSFDASAITRSRQLATLYRQQAERVGCAFLDAALYAEPSKEDSLHLDAENHGKLAAALCEEVGRLLEI